MQESTSLKYEPASKPLHISVKQLYLILVFVDHSISRLEDDEEKKKKEGCRTAVERANSAHTRHPRPDHGLGLSHF